MDDQEQLLHKLMEDPFVKVPESHCIVNIRIKCLDTIVVKIFLLTFPMYSTVHAYMTGFGRTCLVGIRVEIH